MLVEDLLTGFDEEIEEEGGVALHSIATHDIESNRVQVDSYTSIHACRR